MALSDIACSQVRRSMARIKLVLFERVRQYIMSIFFACG